MKSIKPLPPAEQIWEMFDYEPLTGRLIRKEYRCGRAVAGAAAGSRTSKGYLVVKIDDHSYQAHRLIWLWLTGKDPGPLLVDHIDGQKDNNRLINLRLGTNGQNKTNGAAYRCHDRKRKGVYPRSNGKFTSCIRIDGVLVHLGTFKTADEAHAAYCAAAQALRGDLFWRPA